jgi:hypothetical protein
VRRRLVETRKVAAARLRSGLPGTEGVLRAVVAALGSLESNASPGITLADLVLLPWKQRKRR